MKYVIQMNDNKLFPRKTNPTGVSSKHNFIFTLEVVIN